MSELSQYTFGSYLRDCRERASMLQRELADLWTKSPALISKIENDRPDAAIPTEKDIERLGLHLLSTSEGNVTEDDIAYLAELRKMALETRKTVRQRADEYKIDSYFIRRIDDVWGKIATSSGQDALLEDIDLLVDLWSKYQNLLDTFMESRLTFRSAADNMEELIRKKDRQLARRLEIRLRLERGRFLRYMGDFVGSDRELKETLAIFDKRRLWDVEEVDLDIKGRAYIELGDLYRRQGVEKWGTAEEYYNEARELLVNEGHGSPLDHPRIERKLASLSLFGGRPEEVIEALEDCLVYVRNSMEHNENLRYWSPDAEVKTLQHLAWAYSMYDRHLDRALDYQRTALRQSGEFERPPKDMAKTHRFLGDIFLLCGQYTYAKEQYDKAMSMIDESRRRMLRREEETEKLISGMVKLGLGTVEMRDPGSRGIAREYLIDSLYIHEDLQEAFAIGLSHLRLGELHLLNGEPDPAQDQFNSAEVFFRKAGNTEVEIATEKRTGNPYYMAALELCRGELELHFGSCAKSRTHIDAAKTWSQWRGKGEISFLGHYTSALLLQARVELSIRNPNFDKSADLCCEAVVKCVDQESSCLLENVLRGIKEIYSSMRKRHNFEGASRLLNAILQREDRLPLSEKVIEDWVNELRDEVITLDTIINP